VSSEKTQALLARSLFEKSLALIPIISMTVIFQILYPGTVICFNVDFLVHSDRLSNSKPLQREALPTGILVFDFELFIDALFLISDQLQ
jgi:hypothetical protein